MLILKAMNDQGAFITPCSVVGLRGNSISLNAMNFMHWIGFLELSDVLPGDFYDIDNFHRSLYN
jgi:hypothetical protein